MRRLLRVAATLASVVNLLAACAGSADAFPTGKWTATDASGVRGVMEYRTDGTWTFTAEYSTGTEEVSAGTSSTDKEKITFTTDKYCKTQNAEQGTYSWTHANDGLTLTKQSDACADRAANLDRTVWTPAS